MLIEITLSLVVNPCVCRILKIQGMMKEKSLQQFNSISSAIPRVNEYHFNIANYTSCVLGVEDKGRIVEKELCTILEDLPISLSLNPSLIWHEDSLVELELFLESYLSHVNIIEDACAISFGGGLFLVVPSKCVSFYGLLKNQLVINDFSGAPSCFECELTHHVSFFDAKVGGFLEFNCAAFDEILLKDFENQMGTYFEMFKFYHFHFKEVIWLLICGKKMNGIFKVLKVQLCDIVKTTFKNNDILHEFLVQNTNSCVELLNQPLDGTLLYSLTFKELLDELIIFERQDLRTNPFKRGGNGLSHDFTLSLEDNGNRQMCVVEEDQVLLKAWSLGDGYEDFVLMKILNRTIWYQS
ncbi:hypothetical protein M9H77_17576 [Catharanthus roseus]|uniref:Uncharacterized protein n=1 Tax=Catharanthus roseus TaxID=4058 RepID=A0ACC0B518_CATRO|nr:hypothetical protein M9H77_17576 [Catharanthus roseus]